MVVELNIVEINGTADLLVYGNVASFAVLGGTEVGRLRGMADQMVWQQLPQFSLKGDQPLFGS